MLCYVMLCYVMLFPQSVLQMKKTDKIHFILCWKSILCGSLSPWHGMSLCYSGRRQSPDLEGSNEYNE